ncbi:glycosyltransferase family 2 protein [Aequorivita flava]|uniref:Glycosyltransferase n=1 Tax=Aequorivita flava TaxID=3114371 RepID=A0AB35YSU8_9FLAO
MDKLVSIIIPCYNDASFIEQAIDSAFSQTYANKEIIVVDDGSNTETKNIIKSVQSKIDILITQQNKGVCIARNNAIERAKGEYILTLDADDFFEPSFLEKAVDILNKRSNVGMVTCYVNVITVKNNTSYVLKPSGTNDTEPLYYNNSMGSCLYRKSIWQEVEGYDENLKEGFEDWEFNIAISKKGWMVHVIAEILFNYRIKPTSRNQSAKNYQKKIRRYVFLKHSDIAETNFEKTLDFFLDEIEMLRRLIHAQQNTASFRIGHFFVKLGKPILSIFKKK